MKNIHNGDHASCVCRLTFASLECFSWRVIESVMCMSVLIVNLKYRECICKYITLLRILLIPIYTECSWSASCINYKEFKQNLCHLYCGVSAAVTADHSQSGLMNLIKNGCYLADA